MMSVGAGRPPPGDRVRQHLDAGWQMPRQFRNRGSGTKALGARCSAVSVDFKDGSIAVYRAGRAQHRAAAALAADGAAEHGALRPAELVDGGSAGWTAQGPRLGYALVDVWRSAELDRGGRNLEDAMFRLQWVGSLPAGRGAVRWLKEWLGGEDWTNARQR